MTLDDLVRDGFTLDNLVEKWALVTARQCDNHLVHAERELEAHGVPAEEARAVLSIIREHLDAQRERCLLEGAQNIARIRAEESSN